MALSMFNNRGQIHPSSTTTRNMFRSTSVIALLLLSLSFCSFHFCEASVASAPTYYHVDSESEANTDSTIDTEAAATAPEDGTESKVSYGTKIAEGRKRRNKIKGALKRRALTTNGVEEVFPHDDEEMEQFLRYLQFSVPVSRRFVYYSTLGKISAQALLL
jgi:hypothetical protein